MKFPLCLALLLPLLPLSTMADTQTQSLVLGGGCFWCTDAAYKLLPGVKHVTCGYAGGRPATRPTRR